MKRALVIGSSGGIGEALMASLQQRGYDVTGLSRRADGLDLTSEASIETTLGQLQGQFDTVLVATGVLSGGPRGPEKTLKALNGDALAAQFAINAIGPILVLKHAARLLPRNRRVVFAALSARVGSIGDNALGGWYSYRASKAALNQLLHTASIELARTHRHAICVALHPGTVATPFTRNYPDHQTITPQQAADNLLAVTDQLTVQDTGQFFDWAGKHVPW